MRAQTLRFRADHIPAPNPLRGHVVDVHTNVHTNVHTLVNGVLWPTPRDPTRAVKVGIAEAPDMSGAVP